VDFSIRELSVEFLGGLTDVGTTIDHYPNIRIAEYEIEIGKEVISSLDGVRSSNKRSAG